MSGNADGMSMDPASSGLSHAVYDGLTVELTPAPFWRRFFALSVDYGILGVASYVFFIVAGVFLALIVGGAAASPGWLRESIGEWFKGAGTIVAVIIGLLVLLAFASLYHVYFVYFEAKKGATPGKKLFGLKVVSLKGGRLTTSQCVSREVFRYIDVFLFLPGVISWAVTERRQRLGDLFSGCMVTWSETEEKSQNFQYLSQDSYHYLLELLKPRELQAEEAARILQVCYPLYVLGRKEVLSTLDLKLWAEFADGVCQTKAPDSLTDEGKLRFIAELSFQNFGSQK